MIRMDLKLKNWLLTIYRILHKTYGSQKCFLEHKDPFQLMISAILSAQCTDAKVNSVTPMLFKTFPDAATFAKADPGRLEKIIKPVGLYKAKASNIIKSCKMIMEKFDGKVPDNMKDLVSLPGVGRKTANVILGNAFGIPGFPVDTHVTRLLNRIGIASTFDPERIEYVVNENMPPHYWTEFSHLLIQHGRNRCKARKPDCENCEIRRFCLKKFRHNSY